MQINLTFKGIIGGVFLKKKWLTGFALTGLLLTQLPNGIVYAEDYMEPEFKSIQVDKTQVTAGDTVKVSVEASDANSGIASVIVNYSYGFTNDSKTVELNYNDATGKFEGSIPVNGRSLGLNGTWRVSDIVIVDKSNNKLIVFNTGSQEYPGRYISLRADVNSANINVSDNDLTPPTYSNITVDKNEATFGDKIKVSLDATDQDSGVDYATVKFLNMEEYTQSKDFRLDFNPSTKKYEGYIDINDKTLVGRWIVDELAIYDKNLNRVYLHNKETQVEDPEALDFKNADYVIYDKTPPVISGVESGKYYNKEVTPTFNEGTATLNGKVFESGQTIYADKDYKLVVTDKYGNQTSVSFTVDRTAPYIYGLNPDVSVYNKAFIYFDEEVTATLNGKPFTSGSYVTDEGDYVIVVTDKAKNTSTARFTIDNTPPIISGVKDSGKYTTNITPTFNDGEGTITYYAEGPIETRSFKSGETLTKTGSYKLEVKDKAGNISEVRFLIDKDPPEISGVVNGKVYADDVTPYIYETFNMKSITLNGETFKSGTKITKEGNYTLIATDELGNSSSMKFSIDKTPPAISGLDLNSSNYYYNRDVTITFNEGNAIVNNQPYISGTKISKEGNYQIRVEDGNGNAIIAPFVIDKTAPAAPTANDISSAMTKVTGTTEPDSKVTIKAGSKIIGTAQTYQDGLYSINIPKQKSLSKLLIIATDKAGNTSPAKELTIKDGEKPVISNIQADFIPVNSNFDPKAGVVAKDDVDGDITKALKVTSNVNTKVPGWYTLTYSVSDKAGNIETVTKKVRVVDSTAPIISGVADKTITINSIFDSRVGITAKDNADGDLTRSIKVSGSVNTKVKGVYTLTYTVSDKSGNEGIATRKITVAPADNVKPVISGSSNKTVTLNTSFDPKAGVTAKDNIDGDLTKVIKVTGTVNTKVKGVYSLTYTVKDKTGNTATIVRKITVADNVKPVISGAANKSIPINSKFDAKAGVTAKDNIDGNLTNTIKISGTVNTKVKGVYTLSYSVKDKSGNVSTVTRKITVIDNVKPVISGTTNKTIKLNSSFNPRTGVTAKDNVDGNLIKAIQISGSVNTKKKGTYPLTYVVTDKSGNKTTVVRKITVQ